jgi:hypothetical protein
MPGSEGVGDPGDGSGAVVGTAGAQLHGTIQGPPAPKPFGHVAAAAAAAAACEYRELPYSAWKARSAAVLPPPEVEARSSAWSLAA